MTRSSPLLADAYPPSTSSPSPPATQKINSEFAVLAIAAFCGVMCLLALVLVAGSSWLERFSEYRTTAKANTGLKKKILNSLKKMTYEHVDSDKFTECPICIADFAEGDEIRILPCDHGFHVGCVDTWLESHSSCPSCRQMLGEVKKSIEETAEVIVCVGGGSGSGTLQGRRENHLKGCLP